MSATVTRSPSYWRRRRAEATLLRQRAMKLAEGSPAREAVLASAVALLKGQPPPKTSKRVAT